jgi:hypothetical protein
MYAYICTIYILLPEGEDKFAPVPKYYAMKVKLHTLLHFTRIKIY